MLRTTYSPTVGQNYRTAPKSIDPFLLFAVEGALLQLFTSINGFANNLFATSIGASDLQIGLIQVVPNVAAMLLLLPLGILSERLRSSRTIPMVCLFSIALGYLLMAAVPVMGQWRMLMFFAALAFTVGGPALYNAQWQTFFGDVVEIESRNRVLTVRNRCMFTLGIATPLVCGIVMGSATVSGGVYPLFFLVCAGAVLVQAWVISAIRTPERVRVQSGFTLQALGGTVKTLARSKPFVLFYIPVVLFYMTWQMDWSMWYIGQVQYLHLTESQMTTFSGIFNIGQLIAIGLLARHVQKKGTDRTLPFAGLGLMTCPLIMIICSRIPEGMRMLPFTLMVTILNAPQCAVNLCVVQILLRVAPKECRGIAVSLFTLTTTLTNCFMPYLGVQMYTAMGSDYRALMIFNVIVLVSRIATYGLLLWRCRFADNHNEV